MTRKDNVLQLPVIELAQSLMGKQTFQKGRQQQQGGESAKTRTKPGNRFAWRVIRFPWQRGRSWGVYQQKLNYSSISGTSMCGSIISA